MIKKYFSIFMMCIFLVYSLNTQAAEKTSFLGTPYKIFAAGAALGTVFGVFLGWTVNKKFAADSEFVHQATNNELVRKNSKLKNSLHKFQVSNIVLVNLNYQLETEKDDMLDQLVAARVQLATGQSINCGCGLSAMATQECTVQTPATSAGPTHEKHVLFSVTANT